MVRCGEHLPRDKIEPNSSGWLTMNGVRPSREIREEAIHRSAVGGKTICLQGFAEHLFRFERLLSSLASILPIGPGTQITPKTKCQLFGPLFGSVNSWKVCGEPTPYGK